MRCPACAADDDKVIESRPADDGAAIRRRRQCLACGSRYTTFERAEEAPLMVVKRGGERQPFVAAKVVAGVRVAATDRPVTEAQLAALAAEVEEAVRRIGPEVTSEQVGYAVLGRLRHLDAVAAVRFASVYKGFDDLADFAREVTELATEPDQRE